MAAKTFSLRVVTVAESLFDGQATELHCRGSAGAMVVLANHEPLITRVEKSTLRVRTENDDFQEFPIEGGVLEVAGNKAVVLCSSND